MIEDGYRSLSLWHDTLPHDDVPARPPLEGDTTADVVVVGAGFTGLWAAYYLLGLQPTLRVVVLERETAGFGASGRNGGWCSALFPSSTAAVARASGRAAALRQARALRDAVDEVGRVTRAEGIDAHYAKGGTVALARSVVQLSRAQAEVEEAQRFDDADLVLLTAAEATDRVSASGVRGGTWTPHCAAIHPARLVRGLAAAVERRGGVIHERTAVQEILPRAGARKAAAVTGSGTVRADVVVRATEGYTPSLLGEQRRLAPVYSLMVATEPLPPSVWDRIGLRERETFTDYRHLIIYGQRTADDRLAFGGRGAPYHWGSRVSPAFEQEERVFAELRSVLVDLFPAVAGHRFTHAWGGPLGVPRDWFASVGLDASSGIGWAGGYVGDGVGASNLAGRTLAELVTGTETERTGLPWVGHRSPRWEPEPLRWLGVNASLAVMTSADRTEERTGRPSRRAELVNRLVGH